MTEVDELSVNTDSLQLLLKKYIESINVTK